MLSAKTDWLYSSIADDPDFAELVEMFVDEMPDRVQRLTSAFENRQWDDLRRAAHQLKGSGGSYGFLPLTEGAARLEHAVRQQEGEEAIAEVLGELVEICRRVRAGR